MTDRPRALAVLIAVFLLGCILGSAGSYLYLRNQANARRMTQGFPPGGPGMGRQRMPDLQLSPEQQTRFMEIMAESRKQLDAVRAAQEPRIREILSEQEPKIEAIFAETNRKLMLILNEEQQKQWSGFIKDRGNFRRRMPRGDRGMEPPPLHPPGPRGEDP